MKKEPAKEDMLEMIETFYNIMRYIQTESKTKSALIVDSGLYSNIIIALDFYSEKIEPFIKNEN